MIQLRFSHLGVAVPDLEAAIVLYQELLGYQLLSGPFDDNGQHVSVAFVGNGQEGNIVIELVAPLGHKSPVDSVLAKGRAAYHVCYETSNLDASLAEFRAKGCAVLEQPTPALAFEGRKIAWLYMPNRQLIELVESAQEG